MNRVHRCDFIPQPTLGGLRIEKQALKQKSDSFLVNQTHKNESDFRQNVTYNEANNPNIA